VHNFCDTSGVLSSDWVIQVVVKQYDGADDEVGTEIEPMLTSNNLQHYRVEANQKHVMVFIHNYSKSDLTFHGTYVDQYKDEEIMGSLHLKSHRDELNPADYVQLWYRLSFMPGEGEDAFVLMDCRKGTDQEVLRLRFTPFTP
jgi:hypothetical protein